MGQLLLYYFHYLSAQHIKTFRLESDIEHCVTITNISENVGSSWCIANGAVPSESTKSLIFYWSDLNLLPKVAIKFQLNWLKASY